MSAVITGTSFVDLPVLRSLFYEDIIHLTHRKEYNMVSAKYKSEIVWKVRSYFADRILRLLYFLKKNRYGQRRIIMDYKIWIAMVILGEKSEYAIAHLHCSLWTIYTCPISNIAFFCFWKAVF